MHIIMYYQMNFVRILTHESKHNFMNLYYDNLWYEIVKMNFIVFFISWVMSLKLTSKCLSRLTFF